MPLHLHPLLTDPLAVLVYRTMVTDPPKHADFSRVAQEALELMQVQLDGEKVALKPNATSGEHFKDPDLGVGTHPVFVGGMVEYLKTHGARKNGLYIVEDPRDSDDFNPRHWIGTGYPEMAQSTGARLRSPHSFYCVKKNVPKPLIHAVRNVSRYAVDPKTILFNVPKLKTHNLATTTLCLKNLMGLDDVFDRHYCGQAMKDLSYRDDQQPKEEWMDLALHEAWQEGLAKRLADLAQVIQPALNVVEGVVGRDGTGFHRGRNFSLGLVVAGINMVAVDSVASYLMGFDPQQVIYLKVAAQVSLGCNNLAKLQIYTSSKDGLVICSNLGSLRLQPAFRVIRGILDEKP
jgi:uncharacterized protein (DUF362 family)